jgi:hypothetical protein
MNIVEELLKQTDEAETPRTWIKWSALISIAAATSFNVWLDKYYYKLSPNVYALLVGRSGLGKGLPVHIAKSLVEKADNTRVISGRNSIESVIQDLSRTKSRENKPMIADSRGFLVSGEFSNFIIQNPQAMTILTEWYDTHYLGEWKNTLKSTGIEKLKNLNITMLGACSPPHFNDFVRARDIEGGFIGRTMLVYAERRYRINPLVEQPNVPLELGKFEDYMKELSQVKGQFKWSDEGKRLYKDWYIKLRGRENLVGDGTGSGGDKTGTDQRIQDHVCKVAMLSSLSRNTDLILTEGDINEAIVLCTQFSVDLRKITLGAGGKSELAEQTGQVINYLLHSPNYSASRADILSKFWGDMDAFDLDKIEVTLGQARAMDAVSEGNDKIYSLSQIYLEQLEEFKRRKRSRQNE